MRANRGRDTGPEVSIRAALHRSGVRFRKDHRLDLPGGRVRPDLVFTRARLAVFVDGCYWHGCREHRSLPRSNAEFWAAKIEATRARDRSQTEVLREAGWRVIRIWEHEPVDEAVCRVIKALASPATAHSPT